MNANANPQAAKTPTRLYSAQELSRIGLAAAIIIAGAIAIIMSLMPIVGYSSFAHATPKAMLDGAVITLLLGQRTRWRCLALLGIVLGLFHGFILPALPYLLGVMVLAALPSALIGAALARINRVTAVFVAVILYELLASMGEPLRIYFGTTSGSEPLLWWLWMAELPLRVIGVIGGVYIAYRWLSGSPSQSPSTINSTVPQSAKAATRPLPRGPHRILRAGICVLAATLACTVPMMVHSWASLTALAVGYLIFTLAMGLRKHAIHALVAILWGWCIYALASYLYHGDAERIVTLFRTFALRFLPMTLAGSLILATVRPVEMVRLMRRLHVSGYALLPLARVVRLLPEAMRSIRANARSEGRLGLLRRPGRAVAQVAIIPLQWARELARE